MMMRERKAGAITLQQCEAVIQKGLEAFEKVRRALEVIEEMSLYPEQYRDMEAYCDANWELPKEVHDLYAAPKGHVNKMLSMPIAR